jgi:large subunit ribosomal protein L25
MSEKIELSATVRETSGKGPARRIRAKGQIPAVLYGRHAGKPLSIAVDPLALKAAIATPKKLNTVLTLKLDSGERTVLLKDFQTDVVHHHLLHADFLDVRLDEKVLVKVPLSFTGLPVGVAEGGLVQILRRELELLVLPTNIPEKIEVDISPLKIGHSLHVKDVKLPAGVVAKFATNFTIVGVVAPEKEEVAPTPVAAAAAEGAAPAAGAPAAGAPAGGEKKDAAATPAKEEKKAPAKK